MKTLYSPKNNPRVIIIQKLYGRFLNDKEDLVFPKHRFKKFIKDIVNGTIETFGNIRVEGKVVGDIKTKSKAAFGASSQVDGSVLAQNAEVAGHITGTIEVQNILAKTTITEFTGIVNDRLRYLRLNRINDDFSKNNIKFDFGNAMFESLAGAIPASNITLPD